jgi:hypothetical protein
VSNVGLLQVDGKWPDLALMKLSAYHKALGDEVELFSPLPMSGVYDLVYASKIFRFTPDNPYLPPNAIKGGTGYDLTTCLPDKIESCFPDYSLYPKEFPNADAAIGFTTRGCVRHCPFCVVPEKEGLIRVVGDLLSFWAGQKRVILLDNNLTAAPMEHFRHVVNQLVEAEVYAEFSQGLDIRLLSDEHAALLSKILVGKSGHIHFAWDNPADEPAVRRGVGLLAKHMPLRRIIFYVLIGFNTTRAEDEHRAYALRDLGVMPFAMAFNKRDRYQMDFARYVNRKQLFMAVPTFAEYLNRKYGYDPYPSVSDSAHNVAVD